MTIRIVGGGSYNNGGDGLHIEGNIDAHIENFDTHHNGGHGINVVATDTVVDEETKKLLLDLKEALEASNKPLAKKIFGKIADKSVDLAIALIAGKFFS